MSEYQYYEFQALDRTLTQHEMHEQRKYATRATITANTSSLTEDVISRLDGDVKEWAVDAPEECFGQVVDAWEKIYHGRTPLSKMEGSGRVSSRCETAPCKKWDHQRDHNDLKRLVSD
jgi:hypothetical protein